ncbi:helix-turn-helix transcriptional regulator [Acidithiobacillus caldus]
MRTKTAAQFLGVSQATIYRWIREGKLCEPKQVSAGIKGWHQQDLVDFANKMLGKTTHNVNG